MMKDQRKSKAQLIEELMRLRERVVELERAEVEGELAEEALKTALEESRPRRTEISALLEGSRAVLRYRNFADAARVIFDSCKSVIGASAGYVALLTKDGTENDVLFLDSGGLPCTVDPSLPMPIRGLRGETYRTGTVVYDNDFSNSEWTEFMPDGHVSLANVMFAPLMIDSRVVGLLGLANKPGGFTDNDARIAGAFGELASIALLNSRTFEFLGESEERLRSIVDTANDAIITADGQGRIVFWNSGAESTFGYSAEEIVGNPLTTIMPERFHDAHRKALARVVSTGKTKLVGKTVELTGLRKDGSEFPLELSLAEWRTREGVFFTAVCRDIAERKWAEGKLRRSEARYTVAQRLANIGSWDWDIRTGDLYWSERIEPLFGFARGEFGGTYEAFLACVHPDDRQHVVDSVGGCIEEGKEYAIEHRIVWPDGTVRRVLETGDVIRDENGEAIRMLGIVQDITDRARAEEAVRSSQRFLEIANRYSGMNSLLAAFVPEVKSLTGCDAVGVRILDDEGNIPYEGYDGFDREFYDSENPLSIKTDQCMCINVIRGDADPRLPFYTEGGSFYMNGTTRFLATVSEQEKGRTRNKCNEHGYESVALIPIRLGESIVGLIHVADTRENMVPLEKVQMLEGIAMQLGVAIQRARAEEEVENVARFLLENPHPMLRIGEGGRVLFANTTGVSLLSEVNSGVGQPAPGPLAKVAATVIDTGLRDTVEFDHRRHTFSFTVVPVAEAPYVNLYGRDITERKRAEEALHREAEVRGALAGLSRALLMPKPIEEISTLVLEHGKRLTGSALGYVGYIDPNTGYLISTTLTEDIWDRCRVPDKTTVFKEFRGLWGWVLHNKKPLLTNAPAEDPRSSGTPHGHLPIHRFLSAPALLGDTLVGQVALANSERDYNERDLDLVERLAALYAIAVQRKRAEEELRGYRHHLEELVEERTAELEWSHQQLRILAGHLQTAREEERSRVAREIHDELGQVLTGLKMDLSWLTRRLSESAESKSRSLLLDKIGSMLSLVDRTIESVQRIATELRPGVLDDFGLVAAIESQTREFQERTGIKCDLILAVGDTQLDGVISTALFRIIQEALTNVARHAEATRVAISLRRDDNQVRLVVKDNGKGVPEGQVSRPTSLGFLGMRERAVALGGEFHIGSAPQTGTVIRVTIPLGESTCAPSPIAEPRAE